MATVEEVYHNVVQRLRPAERLRLAALILDRLAAGMEADVEFSDAWTDEDMQDFVAYSVSQLEDEPDDVP